MEKHRIFIVEDDRKIAQLLADTLRKYQYDVAIIEDFDQVTEECLAFDPHLILLDINLPSYDGYYWCRQLRTTYDVSDYYSFLHVLVTWTKYLRLKMAGMIL